MGKETPKPSAQPAAVSPLKPTQAQVEQPYFFIGVRRESSMRYRVCWGSMVATAPGVKLEKAEEAGNIAVAMATLKNRAMLFVKAQLERMSASTAA